MLSIDSERRLANLLITLGDSERQIEVARQKVCMIHDFAPYAAFQRFDRGMTNFVNSYEIYEFLRDNQIYHI